MGFAIDSDDLQELVAFCDADGIILQWNRAAEEVTGFSREEVLGYHLDSVIAPGSRDELGRILGIQKTGSVLPQMPVRLQTSFGMEVPTEVTSIPQNSAGTITGWVLIFRDTTLKVQLQEQLDRMDTLYRSLVETSPAIIYVLDAAGKVLFINDVVETLLGYHKSELIGRELTDIVHPEDRDRAYWPLRERRKYPRFTRNLQMRLVTSKGAARKYDLDYIHVSLDSIGLGSVARPSAERREEGGLGTQGIARDITELVLLRQFCDRVELILPICSVCRRIRADEGAAEQWIALDEYVSMKSDTLFSHTYCPDHLPRIE